MKPTDRISGRTVLSCSPHRNLSLSTVVSLTLAVSLFFAGCSSPSETGAVQETASLQKELVETTEIDAETTSASIPLSSPPQLTLTDSLSSLYNPFTLDSGSYEWSVLEQKEIQSVIACGASALDLPPETEALPVTEYQQLEGTPYLVSCSISPDRILLREWDAADLGNAGAEPLHETESEDVSLIHLQPGRVYELTATWDEGKKEERSFFGEASYCFLTK